MKTLPYTRQAMDLLQNGAITLAEIECNGMAVDEAYIRKAIKRTLRRVARKREELESFDVMKTWKKTYGTRVKFRSTEQLGHVLFNVMEYKPAKLTDSGRPATDEESLADIDDPFVQAYLEVKKYSKAANENLPGILREVVNGRIHCFFNLHNVRSFRSCIAKGTLVEVVRDVAKHPKGKPIEDIKTGDLVYCYDRDKRLTIKKVKWAGKTGHKRTIRVHWSARGKHGYLECTPEHRIRVASGVYVRADSLEGRDFRSDSIRTHEAKVSMLAMGRVGDRVFETGNPNALWDHRLVYEKTKGLLLKSDVIHHVDHNHLNNNPDNLVKTNQSTHARHHAPTSLTNAARRKGLFVRMRNHKKFGNRWRSGKNNVNFKSLTKWQLFRMLSAKSGKLVDLPLSFPTVRKRAVELGITTKVLKTLKRRYDRKGNYISRGVVKRILDIGVKATAPELGMSRYTFRDMAVSRGFNVHVPTVHNHKLNYVDYTERWSDVYDLEVEDCHNFIAGELCVHNSSDSFNFQNLPVRNPVIAQLIRGAFIASPGNQIVEVDFSGAEVVVAACYHKDPVMIDYITNPAKDMHRDMAMELLKLPEKEVTKAIRYTSKSGFVFPQFYGDWYMDCAPAIWKATAKLKTENGVLIHKHLAKQGIRELGDLVIGERARPGTFEEHVQKTEANFWGKRFKVYAQWKKDLYEEYTKKGYIETLTGFVCQGHMKKNEVINYPVQGSAFHCLLVSLIQIVRVELKRKRMKTKVVGQIHDSIVADVVPSELDEYLAICKRVMTVDLAKVYKWLIVPMKIEAEVSPVGGSWADKTGYEIAT